jgi:O-antigen/teichoic acid export membrane protein
MYIQLIKQGIETLKRKASSENIRKYLFNTSWLFAERILRLCVGLFVGIWIARMLGPEQYGLLSYAQSLVALFSAISTLGLDSFVIRELVKDEDKNDLLLGTAFVLKFFGGLLVLGLLFIAVNLTGDDAYTQLLIFIIASSTIFQSFGVIDFYFQAKVQSKFAVYASFIVLLINTPIKILLLIYEASLEAFAVAFTLEYIITAIGLVFFYHQQKESIRKWKFNGALAKSLLKDSWPLILSSLSISIGMRIDQVMLKTLIDQTSVGFYAVGVKLAEVFTFIPMIVCQSIFPKIIEMDFQKERLKLIKLIRIIFFTLAFFAVGVNVLSAFAISISYGEEYIRSEIVLDILIWSIPVTFLNIITTKILIKLNRRIPILARQLTLAAVNILLNIILIPKYGIVGAALATLLADISLLFFEVFLSKERWIFFLRLKSIFFISK